MLGFKRYIVKKYIKEQTPKGDLARDLNMDKEFPNIYSKKEGIIYLENYGACDAAINVFKDAWKEYKEYRLNEISKIEPVRRMVLV